MIRQLILWLACVIVQGAPTASAQSAEVAFHDGARVYVDGRLAEAGKIVDDGLAVAPDDEKLLALKMLIDEEQKRQQQSGEGNSEQQEQEEQEQQPQPNQSGEEDDPSQEESGEGEQPEEQEQPGEGEPEPREAEQEQQPENREQESVEAGQDPDQLSRAQAIRILQALQNEEEQLLREVQKIKGRPRNVEKDW